MLNNLSIQYKEQFSELRFPLVIKEVIGLHDALAKTRELYKIEIVISFLKYHSVKAEWLKGNGKVVDILRSGSVGISNLEALFSAAKDNLEFTEGLEKYIKLKLSEHVVKDEHELRSA